jgi:hypothetical protein
MKKIDFKSLVVFEIALLFSVGFFCLDLLPKNYAGFLGICAQTWPKDPKQYQICMEPYYRQVGLAKHIIPVFAVIFIIVPIVFFVSKKKG